MKFASVLLTFIFIACIRCANTQTPTNELVPWFNCPPRWRLYNNQTCYFKVEQEYDWNSAKAFCQAQNSSSNLIDTSDIDAVKTFGWSSNMWVGLKASKPKVFNYLNGTLFTSSQWCNDEPNNWGGSDTVIGEGCAVIVGSCLHDRICSDKLSFVCKQPAKTTLPKWNVPMQSANDDCISLVRKSVLERHNYYRSLHGLQPLATDPQLEKSAQEFAQSQANNNQNIDWSHKNTANENQYIRSLGNPFLPQNFITLKFCSQFGNECVDAWYNEIKFLNFTKLKWSLSSDNVFRLLWKNLTKLGTGTAFGSNKMHCIVQYSPAVDKWRLKGNVLPPLKKTSTPTNSNLTKINDRWNDPLNDINDDCRNEFKKSILERHNFYRSLHGLEPVTVDPELEKSTQDYINVEASLRNHYFDKHRDSQNYDRIELGCPMMNHVISLKKCYELGIYCADNWYKETKLFNFDNPEYHCENDSAVRLLWKNTTKIGSGIGKGGSLWCVTRYYPRPSNIFDVRPNVPPPLDRPLIY